MASLEVKKKAGAYHFKLLAVDMSTPRAAGAGERFYLAGDEQLYKRGAVLSDLREPFLKVGGVCGHCLDCICRARWDDIDSCVHSTSGHCHRGRMLSLA